ncbi:MAG: hypothetical protein IJS28_08525 [Synergistaceae bacterium]|nr:hypothetical protein [Synergistaceae bacterium]
MKLKFFDDGFITGMLEDDEEEKRYKISFIGAEYENDNPELLGVSRITGLEIECEDRDIPDELLYEAKTELWNDLADIEYFDEDGSSRRRALNDIRKRTGVSADLIDINY